MTTLNSEVTNQSPSQYDIESIWKIVTENIRMYISTRHFTTWFKNVYLERIENGIAYLVCDQGFKREWIETNHRGLIKKSLLQATGLNLELVISVNSALKSKTEEKDVHWGGNGLSIFQSNTTNTYDLSKAIKEAGLNPKYVFSSFIVGAHNRLAHAVGEAVAEEPGKAYNPVFFYGPTGVGKTHLMQAVGNEILKRDASKKILYVTIEQFMNELVESIRGQSNESFRKKYREIDVLLIDDIQLIETYIKTQEELFNTFNALHQSNKQIIMAADRSPKEIRNIADRLRSRFEGGMVADIKSPDFETRVAILQQIISDSKVEVPSEIIQFVAQNRENSVRELEGAALKVISLVKIGEEIDISKTAQILQVDIESKRKRIKPEKVIQVVAEVFDVKPKEITGSGRSAYVAQARQVVMYILRKELNLGLERIALEVNRKDHTTVLHACTKIEELMQRQESFKMQIDKCRALLS